MLESSFTVINCVAAAWLSICAAVGTCDAQGISGTVYDPAGGVVAGARVMLMQDYVKTQETKSGETGAFAFADLRPGMYQVNIKQPLFSIFQQTVDLQSGEQARVYALLPLARVVEEFQISTARAPGSRLSKAAERPVRAGGKVQPPKMLEVPRPAYPPAAASGGLDGPVVLLATIRLDGSVGDVVVLQAAHPELEQEAIRALKKCRYQPAELDGQPVENQLTVAFNFRLE
ncbi:MAG: TonB family protein [Acidobacteriia bacterium]|nr:TonB family protein [Terriglobia bacterium]